MTRKKIILVLLLVSGLMRAQEYKSLDLVRKEFQKLKNEDDLKKFLSLDFVDSSSYEQRIITSYMAAGTCMMADYAFGPKSKLKYFKQGKKSLEKMISEQKVVENVYLRLLIQLNIPKILNYHKNINEDVDFLESNMSSAQIDQAYKMQMIDNLTSVATDVKLKEALQNIETQYQR